MAGYNEFANPTPGLDDEDEDGQTVQARAAKAAKDSASAEDDGESSEDTASTQPPADEYTYTGTGEPMGPPKWAMAVQPAEATGASTASGAPGTPKAPIPAAGSSEAMHAALDAYSKIKRDTVDPVKQEIYDAAEDKARDLYNQRADRAEWLSLADRVGSALVRLNAANQGLKYGVDLSHVDLGQGNDWEKEIDRAAKDYQTELGTQERRRTAAERANLSQQTEADRQFQQQLQLTAPTLQVAETEFKAKEARDKEDSDRELRKKIADDRLKALNDRTTAKSPPGDAGAAARRAKRDELVGLAAVQVQSDDPKVQAKGYENFGKAGAPVGTWKLKASEDHWYGLSVDPKKQRQQALDWADAQRQSAPAASIQPEAAGTNTPKPNLRDFIKGLGKTPTSTAPATPAAGPAAQPAAPSQGTEVQVQKPDGTVGTVPRSGLDRVLGLGWKLVQ